MKTTEMIAKVKDAQEYVIVNELGRTIKTDSMRDLGFVLFTVIERVNEGDVWKICAAMNVQFNLPATLLVAVDRHERTLAGAQVTYNGVDYRIVDCESLEFDSFGELENWSVVSEEDATALLTKAPVEPPKEESGINLFKQVFDLLGLKYEDYYLDEVGDEFAQFSHEEDFTTVTIDFTTALVEVGGQPPRKLKITLADAPPAATPYGVGNQVPDTRTGYEVKAS
jgi:hypothetical protein